MPVIADEKELAMTRRDANVSIEQKLCSGRGIKSIQLPYEFYPKTGEVRDGINQRQVPQCRCFPGYTGPNCEIKMDDVSHMHKCFNGCADVASACTTYASASLALTASTAQWVWAIRRCGCQGPRRAPPP